MICETLRRSRDIGATMILLLAAMALLPGRSLADPEEDLRLWTTLAYATPSLGPVRGHLLVQERFSQDVEELERVVVEPWVSAALTESFSVALGYDAHIIEHPVDITEHRIWEQASLKTPLGSLGLVHRARLEQRLIEHIDGASVRLRYMLRATHPLWEPRLLAVASNEVFFTLNSIDAGPRDGFSEDRAFAGLRFALTDQLGVEGGYQLQYVDRPGRDAANHVIVLGAGFAH